MAVEKYQFLNEAGMQKLATELLTKVNARISERIVRRFPLLLPLSRLYLLRLCTLWLPV